MENYELGYLIGATVGLLVGLAVAVPLLKFMKKDGKLKCKYDERQEIVRGRAFKYGFFTYLVYLFLDMIYGDYLERVMERGVVSFAGLILGVVVYAGYAIWNDGYFSLNEYPVRVVLTFAVLSLTYFAVAGIHIFALKDMVKHGVLSIHAITLLCGIMMLIILLLVLVKCACKKGLEEG